MKALPLVDPHLNLRSGIRVRVGQPNSGSAAVSAVSLLLLLGRPLIYSNHVAYFFYQKQG